MAAPNKPRLWRTLPAKLLLLLLLLQPPLEHSRVVAASIELGGVPCNDDCDDKSPGTHFCGVDGECHPFSCQNYFEFAHRDLTGYQDGVSLNCFTYSNGSKENAHGVVYGCTTLFPMTPPTPGLHVTKAFQQKCTAEREGGFRFECYQFLPSEGATSFTIFQDNAESFFPDCEEGQSPRYYYTIASSNHYLGLEELQGDPIVAAGADIDGNTFWSTKGGISFDKELAMYSMYANVVGGLSPTADSDTEGTAEDADTSTPAQQSTGYGTCEEAVEAGWIEEWGLLNNSLIEIDTTSVLDIAPSECQGENILTVSHTQLRWYPIRIQAFYTDSDAVALPTRITIWSNQTLQEGESISVTLLESPPENAGKKCGSLDCLGNRYIDGPTPTREPPFTIEIPLILNKMYYIVVSASPDVDPPFVDLQPADTEAECLYWKFALGNSGKDGSCSACELDNDTQTATTTCIEPCEVCVEVGRSKECFQWLYFMAFDGQGYGRSTERVVYGHIFTDSTEICWWGPGLANARALDNICSFTIDGQKCRSCESPQSDLMAASECPVPEGSSSGVPKSLKLDCTNIVEGAFLDRCDDSGFVGPFEHLKVLLDFYKFGEHRDEVLSLPHVSRGDGCCASIENNESAQAPSAEEDLEDQLAVDKQAIPNPFYKENPSSNKGLRSDAAQNKQSGEGLLRYSSSVGFFDDDLTPTAPGIAISKSDVEGVMCQTQYFMSELIQNATETKSIDVKATEIDWSYGNDPEMPATLNFTVNFVDRNNDEGVVGGLTSKDTLNQILFESFENLGPEGLQYFITNWMDC